MTNSIARQTDSIDSLVAEVADEFLDELSRGRRPDVEDYAGRHPEIAAVLRQVLPALNVMRRSGSDEQPAAAAGSLPESGRLGDFRLIRQLGRGGMGVVYEAEQISLDRQVALKVLPFAAVLDERQLKRFKNEARAAASLDHPNIVGVYSVGCERGVHFYAMQYVEGQTLAEVIGQLSGAADEGVTGCEGEEVNQSQTPSSTHHPVTPSPPHPVTR